MNRFYKNLIESKIFTTENIIASGETKIMAVAKILDTFRHIDIFYYSLEVFPFALLFTTGSKEFNLKMREIMAGTKEGKKIVKNILDEIKTEFKEDEFNEAMNELGNTDEPKFEDKSSYRFDELFGDDIESDDTKEGYDFDELF